MECLWEGFLFALFIAPFLVPFISVSRKACRRSQAARPPLALTIGRREFMQSVADTVRQIRRDEREAARLDDRRQLLQRFDAGVFRVQLKRHSIRACSARPSSSDKCFFLPSSLALFLTPSMKQGGWFLQGYRVVRSSVKDENDLECCPVRGWMALSGQAYWVEESDLRDLLMVGRFHGPNGESFDGEWASSKGERGRFAVFQRIVEDDDVEHIGLPLDDQC